MGRIANDLRLLSSGPNTGLAEIALPPVQPGSSIMPGKVNPVICECLNMICFQAIGNDTCVTLAAQAGQLELNVMMPLIALDLLQALHILGSGTRILADRCVRGVTADAARCRDYARASLALATLLKTRIGYHRASELAREAVRTGRRLGELAVEQGLLTAQELDGLLSPEALDPDSPTT
jgi:aspartate ammonia-lyase